MSAMFEKEKKRGTMTLFRRFLNHPATLFQPSELCKQECGCQQFVTGLEDAIGINKYHWFIN
jgi:hypothetical protein